MTGRERELAAIRHECPDRVPVDVICIETIPQIAQHLGMAKEAVYERLGIDGRAIGFGACRGPVGGGPDGKPMSVWGTVTDGQSCDTLRPYPLPPDVTVSQAEKYAWPDAALFDYQAPARAARDLCDRYAVRGRRGRPCSTAFAT